MMMRRRLAPVVAGFIISSCGGGDGSGWPKETIFRPPTQTTPGAGQTSEIAAPILDLHNRERAAVSVAPLSWDQQLAISAASYGSELAALGRLQHSLKETRPGQGENLWMGTHGAYSVAFATESWAGEKAMFRPGRFPDVSTTGKWTDVAHYTQMIWRGTTKVGCALHQTPKWDYLICRYAPAGNVIGQFVP